MKATTEAAFETLIEAHLIGNAGYVEADLSSFDINQGIIPKDLLDYVQLAQPAVWDKLQTSLGAALPDKVLETFYSFAATQGTLWVLRHGLPFHGRTLRLATFQPAHGLNPEVKALYDANRLTVARQVHYDPHAPNNSIDLVIFLNGIPIVTAELKNALTHQNAKHAVRQYREDRSPSAPLLRFKERALVHFAVGSDEVFMTTRLAGKSTRFLPFNRGHGTGAGNAPVEGKHRTCYLWEDVWTRDSLLDIVARFMHLEKIETTDSEGHTNTKETMIFPRYHQLDAVRRLVGAAREQGAGYNYLVQHSTGSGKSITIAWLAHRLSSLHDSEDKKIYDAVVVITDRLVLDAQLQDTIYQIDHKQGVVQRIDQDSKQLAEALKQGVPIIITTIHKFGFIAELVGDLPDRRYALLVDEAHSSQSGEMAINMKEILGKGSIAAKYEEEVDDVDVPDQAALRAAIARGPQDNLSYFAFTATPKAKTLELFGHQVEGKPAPFHLYSMRQAIEEGFVLDVLRGYTTYRRYFKLLKAVEDDPSLDKRKAARALARFVTLHPTNVAQKTEVIIEHFRHTVMPMLGGRAKAMVVTDSRLMATRYKRSFDKYIKEKGYTDIGVLVAFSGEVRDKDDPTTLESPLTEPTMNRDPKTGRSLPETELRRAFAGDRYNILIVANKYQTGFDQPLLCAMYVDKRLSGIQAVQTLSRLNRCYPGKEETFVLDFVNEREEILESFQIYYEGTTVAEKVDPQRLHELQVELDEAQVYHQQEVDAFAKVFFKLPNAQQAADNASLNAALAPAVDRFNDLEEAPAEAFRDRLVAYCNLYSFLGQVVPFSSAALEKLYAFGKMLLRRLPAKGEDSPAVELGDDVALHYYRLQKIQEGNLELAAKGIQEVYGPGETGSGGKKDPQKEKLSNLIALINERFSTDFDAQDLVNAVEKALLADEKLQQAAAANDKANFALELRPAVEKAMLEKHDDNEKFIDEVLSKKELLEFFHAQMLEGVYRKLKGDQRWVNLSKTLASKGYTHSRLRDRKDVEPWRPAAGDIKGVSELFALAVRLAEAPHPASFDGTKYPRADLSGLGPHLLDVFDGLEKEETKGLGKAERNNLAKSASQLIEPFWARLLAELEPEAFLERMASFVAKKKENLIGIAMLHELLRETHRGPFNEQSFKLSPKTTEGWEELDTFSNAIRDLVALRLKAAHKSPDLLAEEAGQAAWCSVVVILALVEHNADDLHKALGGTTPGPTGSKEEQTSVGSGN